MERYRPVICARMARATRMLTFDLRLSLGRSLILAVSLSCICSPAFGKPYHPTTQRCDGLPQVPVTTLEGLCVGLVAQRGSKTPFRMPRSLVELEHGKLLVVDMGGWDANKGKLWLVNYLQDQPVARELLRSLNLPHKILHGPDGKFYFSEADRVRRFAWTDGVIKDLEDVVSNLPYREKYLHPLKNFAFDRRGDLWINIGSSSDLCEKSVSLQTCVSGVEASVRRYSYVPEKKTWLAEFEVVATGLRNSMVLLPHESGVVLQAENSIDFSDVNDPYEEINLIHDGGFFGWPLCYNRKVSVREPGCGTAGYQEPWSLLPPHVAPLDAIYYRHQKLAVLQNKLLMSWHGYRDSGNRLVAFEVDDFGRPHRQEGAVFWRAPQADGEYTKHAFAPRGELGLVAQHVEVISQWNEIPGQRPKGAPVGLTQAKDGSIFIADDRNAAILRLSTGKSHAGNAHIPAQSYNEPAVIPSAVHQVLRQNCARCHSELQHEPWRVLSEEKWLQKNDGVSLLEQRVFHDQNRPMPPDGPVSEKDQNVLLKWLRPVGVQ